MGLATFLNSGHAPTNLRGAQFFAFSETAYLMRGSIVSDGGGGGTTTWATAGTFPCRVASIGGSPRLVAGQISETSTHVIYGPQGVSVDTDDRIVVSGRGTFGVTMLTDSTVERQTRLEVAPA